MGQAISPAAQIGCYLHPFEAEALSNYARSLELSRPKLCALLIVRAVRSDGLSSLVGRHPKSEPKAKATRVTARLDNPDTKQRFAQSAAALGLGTDDAAALVFRTELADRWLENAIATWPKGNHP